MNSQGKRLAVLVISLFAVLPYVNRQLLPRVEAQASSPDVPDPAALPARDSHQGLLIAADPYLTNERSDKKFGKKNPYSAGLLAIDVYLRNDSQAPLRINLNTVELQVAPPGQQRQRLDSLTLEEVAQRIVAPRGAQPRARRVPLPGVSGGKSKEIKKMEDSLRFLMLQSDLVGPGDTIHGFLIFDLAHHFEDAEHSTLYIPDVSRYGSGDKLFFFEIDLRPAAR